MGSSGEQSQQPTAMDPAFWERGCAGLRLNGVIISPSQESFIVFSVRHISVALHCSDLRLIGLAISCQLSDRRT
jgi:hypothetical protein